jgi:beta-mannosidase
VRGQDVLAAFLRFGALTGFMEKQLLDPCSWAFLEPKSRHWLKARVPGCIHTDLRSHNLIPDPFFGFNEQDLQWIEECEWNYRCRFAVEPRFCDFKHIRLCLDGLDTVAGICLNGVDLGWTENMFVAHRFDVKPLLRAGRNVLEIRFESPLSYIRARKKPGDFAEWNDRIGGRSRIRKQQCSFGWDWGPRFATSGIYKPVRLEAWEDNRFESVRVRQRHERQQVTLKVEPHTACAGGDIRGAVYRGEQIVAEIAGLEVEIPNAELWWPNRHGDQPLYEVRLELVDGVKVLDRWTGMIGLRTVLLDRHPDEFGESFQLVVNDRPIFAKGANWIPAHCFPAELRHADYDNLLKSAVQVHMNTIRVWGGGLYEAEAFYDICDQRGLLVWQDFMFACALYPGSSEFLASVQAEAEYQVKRLANRACLALWCGNNEIEEMRGGIAKTMQRRRAYEELFYRVLPKAVALYDGETSYWPSSPHNPAGYQKRCPSERAGDAHLWNVWHRRHPVKSYEKRAFRFCSEFGMQSFSSPEVAATFCPEDRWNTFGEAMKNHQKSPAGNAIIKDYISRRYRLAVDYESLAYLSQINQAYCLKVAVEHFRRSMPRTMGALYWQLNDCWPGFSWSSLEFGGGWKALHFAARRFFAPVLVSAQFSDEEARGFGRIWKSRPREIHLYTVSDAPPKTNGLLRWTILHFDGRLLEAGEKSVFLGYGLSHRQKTLEVSEIAKAHGAHRVYLRIKLETNEGAVSEDTVFLVPPRLIDFPRAAISVDVARSGKCDFQLSFSSSGFHHAVRVSLPGIEHHLEDNFFDLYPAENRTVKLSTKRPAIIGEIKRHLSTWSLAKIG